MSTPFWQVWLGQTTNSNPQGSGSDASVNSNVLKQTYINRFLDVSGTFTVRYDASINGNLYLGPNSRLGLGLTAPAYILDQSGTARMQSPNSASYTSSPHTNQGNHGLVLTSTKASPGTAYSMGLGIDFSSGAGYITTGFINSSGTPTAQPLILNATGGDVGIGYKNPTAGLFVVGNQTVTGSATLGTYDAPAFYGNTVASFLNSVTASSPNGVSNAATIELGALNRNVKTAPSAGTVYKYALTTSVNNSTGCDFEIKGITTGANEGLDGTAVSRLYISPAGNVGIGTTSPTYKLDIRGTDTANGTLYVGGNAITSSANGVPSFSACTIIANGTAGTICNSTAGNGGLDEFQSRSPFNICDPGYSTYGIGLNMGIFRNTGDAYIQCQAGNTGPRNICLQTYAGRVGIGTTSPAYLLDVNGMTNASHYNIKNGIYNTYYVNNGFHISSDNAFISLRSGAFQFLGSSLGYNPGVTNVGVDSNGFFGKNTSSRRFKENIRYLDNPEFLSLDMIHKYRPVLFNIKHNTDLSNSSIPQVSKKNDYIGYIAEDLDDIGEKHFVVYESDDTTPNSIQYDKIIVHAVECIKVLHNKIVSLETQLSDIEEQNVSILERLSAAGIP